MPDPTPINRESLIERIADGIEARMGPLVGSPEYLADPVKRARSEKRRRESALSYATIAYEECADRLSTPPLAPENVAANIVFREAQARFEEARVMRLVPNGGPGSAYDRKAREIEGVAAYLGRIHKEIVASTPPLAPAVREEGALPPNMKPWAGGDGAPHDWDGGPVAWSSGPLCPPAWSGSWRHDPTPGVPNIIGYKPTPPARTVEAEVEAFRQAVLNIEMLPETPPYVERDQGWDDAVKAYRKAIRALTPPTPSTTIEG